jgi:squalene-hopene/tetraprenyl-beta-curcumene cyclase
MTGAVSPRLAADVGEVHAAAREELLGLQAADGSWQGETRTNVVVEASELLLAHWAGLHRGTDTARAANWIRSRQQPEGWWPTFHGGPGHLAASVLSYAALRLAGDPADTPHLRRAAGWVRAHGGLLAVPTVPTVPPLALLGLWPWNLVPTLPVEAILLPTWFPVHPDKLIGVNASLIGTATYSHFRPTRPVGFALTELIADDHPSPGLARRSAATGTAVVDRLARLAGRRRALHRAEQWILDHQDRDGTFAANWASTMDCLVALLALGHPPASAPVRRCVEGLRRFVVDDGDFRRIDMFPANVWDTALAVLALRAGGLPPDDPRLHAAVEWLLRNEADEGAGRPAGGWPYGAPNRFFPDVDDTSMVLRALRSASRPGDPRSPAAAQRAVGWLQGKQLPDGGWSLYKTHSSWFPGRGLLARVGLMESSSPDMTAHALQALAPERGRATEQLRRGTRWLLRAQQADGSWAAKWGCYHLFGTAAAVEGLLDCGTPPSHPAVRQGVRWLVNRQNPDGGWGESIRALVEPELAGRGESTVSQTSWVLLALIAACGPEHEAVHRGMRFLVSGYRDQDEPWAEPQHTWVVVPHYLYWIDTLMRLVCPTWALARYLEAKEDR